MYYEIVYDMLVNVNVIYYVPVCEQERWARSAGNSAIEKLCIIIIIYYRFLKMPANEQFFVGAQTVVTLLQTTQIKQGLSFIATNKVCTIVWIETELFLLPGVDVSHVYVCAWALGFFHSHISTQTFRRALTASADSCAEIKSAPSVA